eukprot:Nk52_evm24s163 gene=Nk52_evmTU24s163
MAVFTNKIFLGVIVVLMFACNSVSGNACYKVKCGSYGSCVVDESNPSAHICECPYDKGYYNLNNDKSLPCQKPHGDKPGGSGSTNPCYKVKCGSYGVCRKHGDDSYRCECPSGSFNTYGDLKKPCLDPCKSVDCGYNGKCHAYSWSSHKCVCNPGYTSGEGGLEKCMKKNPCSGVSCGSGRCESIDGEDDYICKCDDSSYTQSGPKGKCEVDLCAHFDCGHGKCVTVNPFFTPKYRKCECDSGYEPSGRSGTCIKKKVNACQNVNCGKGNCHTDNANHATCVCFNGSVRDDKLSSSKCFNDPCKSECGKNGTCKNVFGNDGVPHPQCTCNKGYERKHGKGICTKKSDSCSNADCGEGQCTEDKSLSVGYKCTCKAGFVQTGMSAKCILKAEADPCKDASCGEHGHCKAKKNSFVCKCDDGYKNNITNKLTSACVAIKDKPEVDRCANSGSSCGPQGLCTSTKDSFECTCKSGFQNAGPGTPNPKLCVSSACATSTKLSDLCGDGSGKCIPSTNGFTCQCSKGYRNNASTGKCELEPKADYCDNVDCGFGICKANSTSYNYMCVCQSGYVNSIPGYHTSKCASAKTHQDVSEGSSGLGIGAIIGIAAGVGAFVGLIVFLVWFVIRRKQKKIESHFHAKETAVNQVITSRPSSAIPSQKRENMVTSSNLSIGSQRHVDVYCSNNGSDTLYENPSYSSEYENVSYISSRISEPPQSRMYVD